MPLPLNNVSIICGAIIYSHAEVARAPRRPKKGSSIVYPAINALGMPQTEIMTCCANWLVNDSKKVSNTDVAISGEIRRVLKLRSATG